MQKFLYSSLAGGIVMLVVFFVFGHIDMTYILSDPDVYHKSPYIDYRESMHMFLIYMFLLKWFHAYLMAYLHEKIPRCEEPMFSKIWRFGVFSFFLFYGVGLLMTAITMEIETALLLSWAANGFFQCFFGSAVMIPIIYKYPAPGK